MWFVVEGLIIIPVHIIKKRDLLMFQASNGLNGIHEIQIDILSLAMKLDEDTNSIGIQETQTDIFHW